MNVQQLLEGMAQHISAGASAKTVYGDPVTVGSRTVVPVARVDYAFGAGGGRKGETERGGGGGGRVSARPCGALEVSAAGTRFIPFEDRRRMGLALLLGVVLGAALIALAGPRQIEVKRQG